MSTADVPMCADVVFVVTHNLQGDADHGTDLRIYFPALGLVLELGLVLYLYCRSEMHFLLLFRSA